MNIDESWLRQGHFVLGGTRPSFTQVVREKLCDALGLPKKDFGIHPYPGRGPIHTIYWRKVKSPYREAQFYAHIADCHAVLSLGVSVEKGYEAGKWAKGAERMGRRDPWDWRRLVKQIPTLLKTEIPIVAKELSDLSFQLYALPPDRGDEESEELCESRIFSMVDGDWFERGARGVKPEDIEAAVAEFDERKEWWVEVHFAKDLSLAEAARLDVEAVVSILKTFNEIRTQLRGEAQCRAGVAEERRKHE